jgi:hypothetical protein
MAASRFWIIEKLKIRPWKQDQQSPDIYDGDYEDEDKYDYDDDGGGNDNMYVSVTS